MVIELRVIMYMCRTWRARGSKKEETFQTTFKKQRVVVWRECSHAIRTLGPQLVALLEEVLTGTGFQCLQPHPTLSLLCASYLWLKMWALVLLQLPSHKRLSSLWNCKLKQTLSQKLFWSYCLYQQQKSTNTVHSYLKLSVILCIWD